MIQLRKINKEIVEPIPIKKLKEEEIKGYCLFPNVYSNIFLVARKKSGKTSTIFKIMKKCVGKKSIVYIFATTAYKDPNLIHIYKFLKKRKIEVHRYLSIQDHTGNVLSKILKKLQVEEQQDSDSEKEEDSGVKKQFIDFGDEEENEKQEYKPKKVYPEHIFIFDDLGDLMRDKTLNILGKTNRHYKAKLILSSQYFLDWTPEFRKQADYILIFGGHSLDKLETMYKDMDLTIPFDLFIQLYEDATKEKYNFLYVDVRDDKFRKNFDKEYVL